MRRRTDITASDTPDGRTARSDRTHNAVVAAFLRLLDEGNLRPTTEQIAERAAVSPRSVYQHFPERDALLIAPASTGAGRHGTAPRSPQLRPATTG